MDGTREALRLIAKSSARFGATGFLATAVYRPEGDNAPLELAAHTVGEDLGGAQLLGIHLEGPFIAPGKCGMIQPNSICPPSAEMLDRIHSLIGNRLKMMTIAPELPGNHALIHELAAHGALPSFGHSLASYEETKKGFEAGIHHVTHFFNAMHSLHHREPGPLPAIFESPSVSAQIISDGVHIHPSVLKMAANALGSRRIITITDGIRALGLPDGEYEYNGVKYHSIAGAARYADGTLIGTALGMSEMVARLARFTGLSFEEAWATGSENPARLLGLSTKGALREGFDADIVLLDDDGSVWSTLVSGRIVWSKERDT